jgi:hypothetical protein
MLSACTPSSLQVAEMLELKEMPNMVMTGSTKPLAETFGMPII